MSGEARGYSWKPFEKGNQVGRQFEVGNDLTLTHGAYAPRRIAPLAAELLEQATAEAQRSGSSTGYLAEPGYRVALVAWAECEARCELVREYLGRLTDDDPDSGRPGDLDEAGDVRPAAELLLRLENQALKHRERLGLDPLARARLGRDVAAGSFDLARVMAAIADEDDAASDALRVDGADDGDVLGDT